MNHISFGSIDIEKAESFMNYYMIESEQCTSTINCIKLIKILYGTGNNPKNEVYLIMGFSISFRETILTKELKIHFHRNERSVATFKYNHQFDYFTSDLNQRINNVSYITLNGSVVKDKGLLAKLLDFIELGGLEKWKDFHNYFYEKKSETNYISRECPYCNEDPCLCSQKELD